MLFPYTLGIVAIMKNEAPYVKEWLDYHLNAGVDIVYLYDNDSTDNLQEIVSPYIASGRVIYHKISGDYRQLPCYHDALAKYRYSCKYLAFIDADEFIYPTDDGSIKDFVENYFKDKENVGGLLISWYFFGSSGEKKADLSRGVLERFQKRGSNVETTFKSIINPRLVYDFIDTPHEATFLYSIYDMDELGKTHFDRKKFTGNHIFIAHYAVKSEEEYYKKIINGDAFYKKRLNLNEYGYVNEKDYRNKDKNEVNDSRVYRYYLRNMSAPLGGGVDIIECLQKNYEILKNGDINMEDYLALHHLYTEHKNLLNEQDFININKCLNQTFNKILTKGISFRHIELLIMDIPYLLTHGIERWKIKELAFKCYDIAENHFLKRREFFQSAMLRINKKWLDIL